MKDRLEISEAVFIPLSEIKLNPIRASGPGGQNVNKVSSAIHLQFDVMSSSLDEEARQKILALSDRRLSAKGIINIKIDTNRSQARNKALAYQRLAEMLAPAFIKRKKRKPTKPTKSAVKRRLKDKAKRAKLKQNRQKPPI